jgi:peptidoglycan/xylan/chitin deacetylase (PgdA/CDA1 family)/CelD/BcsL family acetyltransferase involved in cellulose biosynthesis
VVPLAPAMEALGAGRPLPRRAVALTFDDGYRDNLDLAVPLLEELRLPATFFVVPGLLSGETRAWWEILGWGFARSTRTTVPWDGRILPMRGRSGRSSFMWVAEQLKTCDQAGRDRLLTELLELLQPEGEPNDRDLFLDWDGARELVRRGFSVGSHSMRHAILARETAEEQARDLIASRRRLESELDAPMELLSYPNGTRADYDANTVSAVRRAGHSFAFGIHAGIVLDTTPPYAAPRFAMEPMHGFSGILARRVMAKVPAMGRPSRRSPAPPQVLRQASGPERMVRAVGGSSGGVPPIQFDLVGLEDVEQEWRELALQTRNIFSTWDWASLWWRHFAGGRQSLIASCRFADGRAIGILPLYLWSSKPLRILRFIGHGPADQLGPIAAPGDMATMAQATRKVLQSLRWEIFVGEQLPAPASWSSMLGAKVIARDGSLVLRTPAEGWQGYLAGQSSNFRQKLRYFERRLAREHDLTFRLVEDRRDLPAALDTLFRLHALRWPEATSAFLPRAAFHREFAATALERGWLRLWLLHVDGQPVAAWYGFRFAGAECYYQAGRDPAWDRHSVGFILLAHTIRAAFEDGVEEYRFLHGHDPYKYRFTDEDPRVETIALTQGVAARATLWAARMAYPHAQGRIGRLKWKVV